VNVVDQEAGDDTEKNAVRVAVLLVSNRRNGISADGRMVDRAVAFLVDLADEDAVGKGTSE
jgi:hypothetical protein